jgi:hypothetical protein
MGGGRGVVRILALEAVAAAPTVLVLQGGLRAPFAVAVAAACLAAGYLLLRLRGARPVAEGAWLGMAVGGGLGLAFAMGAHDAALGLCPGAAVGCGSPPVLWLRSWMIALAATSGIGLAAGFLANYDRHSRDLRARRAALAADAFARVK